MSPTQIRKETDRLTKAVMRLIAIGKWYEKSPSTARMKAARESIRRVKI